MAKNIILTGSDGGFNNLGDEFILDAIIKKYLDDPLVSTVYLLTAKPVLSRYTSDKLVNLKDGTKHSGELPDLNDIALVHYYGGGYLNSYWYDEKMWLYRYLVSKGFPKNKIIFTGQGVGPLDESKASDLYKVSEEVAMFDCRDLISLKYLGAKAFCDFDDTITLMPKFGRRNVISSKSAGLNLRLDADYVGISSDEAASSLNAIMLSLSTNGINNIEHFTMVGTNEYYNEFNQAEKALDAYKSKPAKSDIDVPRIETSLSHRPDNYLDLMSKVASKQIVITTSYHVVMACLYTQTPVIALYANDYYRDKFEGLAQIVGNSRIIRVGDFNDFNKSWIDSLLSLKFKNLHRWLLYCKMAKLKRLKEKTWIKINNIINT